MRRLTDTQVRGCQKGRKISESVEPTGSLVLWHKASGNKEWYYRKQFKDKADINEKLGSYPNVRLVDARELAVQVANIVKKHPDLKQYRQIEAAQKRREKLEAEAEVARQSNLGTLGDLCRVYVAKMRNEGKKSYKKVESALKLYVLDPFPELAATKANRITTGDISRVISRMLDLGITTHTNRTRGDLHAAFNVGLCYDYSPALRCDDTLFFDIHINPVSRIKPTKQFERCLMRNLSGEELRDIWNSSPVVMNPVYSALLRVMICTGFHPAELLRLKCGDVSITEKAIYMVDTKSGVPNLIPLNRFAINELKPLFENSNTNDDLFPSRSNKPKSDVYARVSVLGNQISRLRKALPDIEHFTARDFRRTVKTLMGKAGISKEMRDRLQNHALSDVSSRHYDRYDYWEEKKEAMQIWESWLNDCLSTCN